MPRLSEAFIKAMAAAGFRTLWPPTKERKTSRLPCFAGGWLTVSKPAGTWPVALSRARETEVRHLETVVTDFEGRWLCEPESGGTPFLADEFSRQNSRET